jgi:hypothetical protein
MTVSDPTNSLFTHDPFFRLVQGNFPRPSTWEVAFVAPASLPDRAPAAAHFPLRLANRPHVPPKLAFQSRAP